MAVRWHGGEVGGEAGEDRPCRFKILDGCLVLSHVTPHHRQAIIRAAAASFDFRIVALLLGNLLEKRDGALQQLLA